MNKDFAVEITLLTEELIPSVKQIEIETGLSPWTFEDYKNEISRNDSIFLVAKIDKSAVGFLASRLIMQESEILSQYMSEENLPIEAEIYNIAVKTAAQNKGIGQILLNNFLARADEFKVDRVWLEVRKSNNPARNFYKKNGFVETQIRKGFYKFPFEDAVLMKLSLKAIDKGGI